MYFDRWRWALPLRLREMLRPDVVRRERDEELRFHTERHAEQLVANGMSPNDAHAHARRAVAELLPPTPRGESARGNGALERFWRDVRLAMRALLRSPGYALVAVLTLTIGIGANTAMFTVVDAVLLRPLPYADPSRLVVLKYDRGGTTIAPATFNDWMTDARAYERTALAEWWTPNLTGGDRAESIAGIHIGANLIPMFGVKPLIGRAFTADEEHEGRNHVVVLRYDFWQRRFGGDSSVVGREMTLEGEKYTVVGVMPPGYRFVPFWANGADIAAPLVLDKRVNDREGASLRAFARLRAGTSIEQARHEMRTIGPRLARITPGEDSTLAPVALQSIVTADVDRALLVLLGAVGFVLLLACANVAHLQLVRAASRGREMALRIALGGSRVRLAQQSLAESVLLATIGAAGGLAFAWGSVRALVALAPANLPRLDTIAIDGRVMLFVVAVTAITALAFGLAPALASTRTSPSAVLRDGGRGSATGGRRTRSALVVSEFAAALILLAGAGLMVRSFSALLSVDAGYDRSNLLSMVVSAKGTTHGDDGARARFYSELVDRVRELPGVRAASATNHLPLHGDHWHFGVSVQGRPYDPAAERESALFRVVRPGYFATMRIAFRDGRDINTADETAHARVVVVNQALARRLWPERSPLGERITFGDPTRGATWFTVIGVVNDVRQESWDTPSGEEMYFPALTRVGDPAPAGEPPLPDVLEPRDMTLVVRTAGDPAAVTRAVQRVVHQLDVDAPVSDVITMSQAVDEQLATPRFYLMLFGAFAGVALALAAVGVYGVMAYAAARRTREMGIRLALGAAPADPFRLVLREGMKLAAIGGGAGLVIALVATRAMRSLLYGVSPADPATLLGVVAVLGMVAVAACCVPAWRASRVDPATTLRSE